MTHLCLILILFYSATCPPPYSYPYLSPSSQKYKSNPQSLSSPISSQQQKYEAIKPKVKEEGFGEKQKVATSKSQIEEHKSSSSQQILFIESLILITFFSIVIFACLWWKRKRLANPIEQKPIQLKQILLASMELQAAEKRLTNSQDVTQRSSQPHKLL